MVLFRLCFLVGVVEDFLGVKLLHEASHELISGERFRSICRTLRRQLPKLEEPGDLVTTTAQTEVALKPGAQTTLTVDIERRNDFKGRVPLEVRGLPYGVRVLDIGLNGILVNENETRRTIVIYAEPWVQAMERPFVVLAKREGKNTEHAAKSLLLKVVK